MGERVARVRTEVSESQVAQAILEAWQDMFKTIPSKEQVSLVLAQNALETGHRKSMWNFNIGNITTDGKGVYNYFDDLKTDEQTSPGVWKKMNLKYRAYNTLKDGVKDYLKLLSGKRYSSAWDHIVNPDPVAFSKALKQNGYYTANEAPYTKTLSGLYSHFNKSKSYDEAKAGHVVPSTMVAKQDSPQKFDLNSILNSFLNLIHASERNNKKLYKQFLPSQNIVIGVTASTHTDAIEFSRILCAALDEELMARAFIHTNNEIVEVECAISGPATDCFETVKQLTNSLAQVFKKATIKIGGINIATNFVMNKKSSYHEITLEAAQSNYRKFLLKFA